MIRWVLIVITLIATLFVQSVYASQPMPMPAGPPKTPSVMPTIGPPGASPPGVWKENWNDLSQWNGANNCSSVENHLLTLKCYQGASSGLAITSKYKWSASQSLRLSGTVMGKSASYSSTLDYWAGHVMFKNNTTWIQLVSTHHVPPFDTGAFVNPLIAFIVTGPNNQGKLMTGSPGQTYNFRTEWNAINRTASFYVDGQLKTVQTSFLNGSLELWMICGAQGEFDRGLPLGEYAHCEFGPITMESM